MDYCPVDLACHWGGLRFERRNSRAWNWIAWRTKAIVIGMKGVMRWGLVPGH